MIRRQGGGLRETFTVRKISFGVGVERTFPVHSPSIAQARGREPGPGPPRQAVLPAGTAREEGADPRAPDRRGRSSPRSRPRPPRPLGRRGGGRRGRGRRRCPTTATRGGGARSSAATEAADDAPRRPTSRPRRRPPPDEARGARRGRWRWPTRPSEPRRSASDPRRTRRATPDAVPLRRRSVLASCPSCSSIAFVARAAHQVVPRPGVLHPVGVDGADAGARATGSWCTSSCYTSRLHRGRRHRVLRPAGRRGRTAASSRVLPLGPSRARRRPARERGLHQAGDRPARRDVVEIRDGHAVRERDADRPSPYLKPDVDTRLLRPADRARGMLFVLGDNRTRTRTTRGSADGGARLCARSTR